MTTNEEITRTVTAGAVGCLAIIAVATLLLRGCAYTSQLDMKRLEVRETCIKQGGTPVSGVEDLICIMPVYKPPVEEVKK